VPPALPALLLASVVASGPIGVASSGASSTIRCDGRAAPRLHEETANVSVTRLRTERAAREDAVRACLAAIRGLRIGGGTVGERLARDPQLSREVERVVRSTRPDAPRLFADGGVALRLAVRLDGELSRLLAGADTWPSAVGPASAPGRAP
jgi:hypothetical protein